MAGFEKKRVVVTVALISALAMACAGCGTSASPTVSAAAHPSRPATERATSSRPAHAHETPGAVLEAAARSYAKTDFAAYCAYLSPAARQRLISEAEKGKSCPATIEALRGPPGSAWMRESDEAELEAAAELRVSDERLEGDYAVVTTFANDESPGTHSRALRREHGRWMLARSIFVESGGTNEEPE